MKSTVHLTGNPSPKTKQRIIDLVAPYSTDIVTTSCREASRPSSRSSSFSDLTALEAGDIDPAPQLREYRGALKGERDADRASASAGSVDGGSRAGSDLGGSVYWGGSVAGSSILGRSTGGSALGSRGRQVRTAHGRRVHTSDRTRSSKY